MVDRLKYREVEDKFLIFSLVSLPHINFIIDAIYYISRQSVSIKEYLWNTLYYHFCRHQLSGELDGVKKMYDDEAKVKIKPKKNKKKTRLKIMNDKKFSKK